MKRPSIGWTAWGLLIHAVAASAVLAAGAVWDGSAVLAAEPEAPAAPNAVQFGRDVLPILSDHCFACHGPDAKNRAGDLRLDTSEGALRQESPVIVPGKSDASELVRRISSQDPDQVMPPPSTKRPLTARQIDVLRRWIDSGAAWGRHWAYEPARRPAVPAPREAAGIKNPIDAFIRERLEREGLRPAPEMSREKLLRRVTLDLTGLPPTLEELDAFLADTSPDAYEQVVDRLLRSPRYGERMVWEWLDAARYADTNGYQGDPTRSMWFWRDWAIDALNANMPFDQFTIEQLAGDLLPAPTQSQLIATGFHRNHMINGEGGRIAEESRIDYVQDRVETTGAVWMGLTLNCCRCHDHKYDPLTQREYYQLFAYFNSIDESGGADAFPHGRPVLQVKTPEIESKLAELRAVEMRADEAVRETEKTARERQAEWEAALRAAPSSDKSADKPTGSAVWQPIVWQRVESKSGATATLAEDQTIVVGGANPAKDDLVARGEFRGRNVTGLRLETLPDAAFVNKGPGRADNGNYVLTELKVLLDGKPVALRNAAADFAQDGWAPAGVLDGKSESGWAIMPKFGEPHVLTVETVEPLGDGAAHELTVVLEHQSPHVAHVIGKFRLSTTTLPRAEWRGLPPTVAAILGKPVEQRGDAERKELADFYLSTRPEVATARQTRDRARQAREQAEKQIPTTMIMRERAQPRETRMLVRGAWDKPSDPVSHGVPAALPALPADAPANRLALARWLVSAEHPLTARVTVNRLWQQLFGAGLVKTSEDFGIQGERPSHPELLDWLACEFREPTVDQPTVRPAEAANAWNVKHMVRLIVTSATYRQSSKVSAEQWERDPENRLLARGPRYRWPSWMIRDQALAASGLLVDKRGGPPVRGYQPPGIWEEATFGKIGYSQDHGEALYRRSVYQFWRRIVGPTVFFDVANRQTCVVRGARTNTPLHALVTLNDVTYVEAARALAQTVLKTAAANDRERLASAFRRCTARMPRADELDLLAARLDRLRQAFAQDPPAAKKLVATGESPVEANLDPVELAAFTSVALLILNLDETQSKE